MKQMNLIVILLLSLGIYSCGEKESFPLKPNVKVMEISRMDSVSMKSYSGILRAARETDLAFRVAGPIKKIYVREGQAVEKGQLLAEIDPRDYEIQLAGTRAQYEQVLDEYNRMKSLYEKNRIAENDFNKIRSGLKQLEAKLHAHENMLKDTRLTAPFNGYVQKKYFETNETVNRGIPVISLISDNYLEVETHIPASMYVWADRFVRFECESNLYPGHFFPLEFIKLQHKANLNQLYGVRMRLNRSQEFKLASGMNVNVRIFYKNPRAASLRIPVESVLHGENSDFVWILNTVDSTVNRRSVHTGKVFADGTIQLLGGLRRGDVIVVAGMHHLHEGETVRVLEKSSATNVGGLL